jgi:hypothetical protein
MTMATQQKVDLPRTPIRYADKEAMNRLMDEVEERMGFVPDPEATPQRAREQMLADGVRSEDNGGSGEIMRMRYGDDSNKE